MKYIKLLLIILFCILIAGCKDKDAIKVINKSYIEKNDGVIFDKYAIALDEKSDKNVYALFEKKSNDRYEKLYSIKEYKSNSKILYAGKYIYFFEENASFIGYRLDTINKKEKVYEPSFDDIDGLIYFPNEVYGFNENYIYMSYFKDSKKRDILYAKVKYDLSSYESITKEDLLDNYEYVLIDKK